MDGNWEMEKILDSARINATTLPIKNWDKNAPILPIIFL